MQEKAFVFTVTLTIQLFESKFDSYVSTLTVSSVAQVLFMARLTPLPLHRTASAADFHNSPHRRQEILLDVADIIQASHSLVLFLSKTKPGRSNFVLCEGIMAKTHRKWLTLSSCSLPEGNSKLPSNRMPWAFIYRLL